MGIAMANPQAALATGSTESAVVSRMALVASPMGLATVKSSVAPMLVRNAHQDDVVTSHLASVALPIGMAMTKPTTAATVMV
jgi:hypothetical protein